MIDDYEISRLTRENEELTKAFNKADYELDWSRRDVEKLKGIIEYRDSTIEKLNREISDLTDRECSNCDDLEWGLRDLDIEFRRYRHENEGRHELLDYVIEWMGGRYTPTVEDSVNLLTLKEMLNDVRNK